MSQPTPRPQPGQPWPDPHPIPPPRYHVEQIDRHGHVIKPCVASADYPDQLTPWASYRQFRIVDNLTAPFAVLLGPGMGRAA